LTVKELNVGLAICYKLSVAEHQKSGSDKGAKLYMAGMIESCEGIESSLKKVTKTASEYSMLTLMSNCIVVSEKHQGAEKYSRWNQKEKLIGQLNSTEEGVLIYDNESTETFK
jgi:predicted amidohydrolase